MKILQGETTALVGTLGYLYWDLPTRVEYVAGTRLQCSLYLGNATKDEHSYMLRTLLYKGGVLLSEDVITVNNKTWFMLDSWQYATVSTAIVAEESNATLVTEMVERETGEVTASTATQLVQPSVAELPIWGELPPTPAPTTTVVTELMPLIVIMMLMAMVMPMMRPTGKKYG